MRTRLPAHLPTRLTVLATALLLTAGATTAGTAAAADAPRGRGAKPLVTTYPVPTAGAGLGRIATATDGTMWFVERSAHKAGRITTLGVIGERPFPSVNAGPQLQDLDVAPDGLVWVVYDSGRLMLAVDGKGTGVRPVGGGQGFTDALATSVRVAPDGVVWNTIVYPATGQTSIARTFATGPTETPADGAPACDGALAPGSDGAMWCRSGTTVLRMASPPQGSATLAATPFLAGLGAQVRDLAAGPVGSIWFSRYDDGATPGGQVGWIDQSTGAATTYSTGAASAPGDLVAGPDGRMWFTNGGAEPGIGYVDAAGRGGLLRFGSRVPTSLTFAKDGTLWFTDATNNTVSRVATTALPETTRVAKAGKTVRVRKGKVSLKLTCAPGAVGGCAGTLLLRTNAKVRKPGKAKRSRVTLTRKVPYALAPGTSQSVRLPLTRTGRAVVRRGRLVVRVQDGSTRLAKARLRR